MNYIVLDLEWNQSSTGKEPEVARMPFEIIEIGAVKLNEELKMISEFSELIKPQVYLHMHHITSKLIHLQMKELQRGDSFQNVSDRFLKWCGEDYRFVTWGPTDLTELQRNLRFFEKPLLREGPISFFDAQKLFSLAYEEDIRIRRNLEYAVDFLKIEKDIPFHRAFSDAYYTAKVLDKILGEHPELIRFESFDVTIPPRDKASEIHRNFGTYEKYISREFESRDQLLQDKEVFTLNCYKCGKSIRKKIHWFSGNGKNYLSLGKCEIHGFVKGKLRMQKSENEKVFVVKTVKIVPPEEAKKVETKHNKAVELKKKHKNSSGAKKPIATKPGKTEGYTEVIT